MFLNLTRPLRAEKGHEHLAAESALSRSIRTFSPAEPNKLSC